MVKAGIEQEPIDAGGADVIGRQPIARLGFPHVAPVRSSGRPPLALGIANRLGTVRCGVVRHGWRRGGRSHRWRRALGLDGRGLTPGAVAPVDASDCPSLGLTAACLGDDSRQTDHHRPGEAISRQCSPTPSPGSIPRSGRWSNAVGVVLPVGPPTWTDQALHRGPLVTDSRRRSPGCRPHPAKTHPVKTHPVKPQPVKPQPDKSRTNTPSKPSFSVAPPFSGRPLPPCSSSLNRGTREGNGCESLPLRRRADPHAARQGLHTTRVSSGVWFEQIVEC